MTGGRAQDGEEGRGVNWSLVAAQVVGYSLLAWAVTFLLALALVAVTDRGLVDSLRLSAWLMVILVLVGGVVGAAGGPIPLSRDSADRLVHLYPAISRAEDMLLRPLRTRTRGAGEERRNGLTALGLALAIVPQLIFVVTLLEGRH